MISANMLKVSIDEHPDFFVVNGVTLSKDDVFALFPNNEETAIAKFLCACPAISDRADHLMEFHKLSPTALWYVRTSKEVVKAIGLEGDNIPPFVIMALMQAKTTPDELLEELEAIFGHCAANEEEETTPRGANVVKFNPNRKTLH